MSKPHSSKPASESGCYEIRFQGHLHARWGGWFDALTVTTGDDGTTLLRGDLADQAALHGLLRRLADLALPLLSVTRVGPSGAAMPATN